MILDLRRAVVGRSSGTTACLTATALTIALFACRYSIFWRGADVGFGDDINRAVGLRSAAASGLLAHDAHLADGTFSHWVDPQLGILNVLLAKLVFLANPSAGHLMAVVIIVNAGLLAAAVHWTAHRITQSPWSAAVVAVCVAASPFCLVRVGHFNVMAAYLPTLAVGILLNHEPLRRQAVLLAVVALVAPPWWQAATGILLLTVLLVALLGREQALLKRAGGVLLAAAPGMLTTLVIARHFEQPGAVATRDAWDSNFYGGHLLDVLADAPLLGRVFPALNPRLRPGFSIEEAGIGTIMIVSVLALLIARIIEYRRLSVDESTSRSSADRTLGLVLIATLLTFLVGGTGEVQAGLAVLAHGSSPARVWSRLSIVLAVVVVAATIRALANVARRWLPGFLVLSLLVMALDYDFSAPAEHASQESLPITAAQLQKLRTADCRVLQIPIGTFPVPRGADGTADFFKRFYFWDLRPYLAHPDIKWTAGGNLLTNGNPTMLPLAEAVAAHTAPEVCAMLIDWDYLDFLTSHQLITSTETALAEAGRRQGGRYTFVELGPATATH